ncbi:MAG: hypothetical protein JW909_03685 [Planctomycetes bacterium]|nr:hypothetical protein [Planctomycetota bacterium]
MSRIVKWGIPAVLCMAAVTFYGCGGGRGGSEGASAAFRLNFFVQPAGAAVDNVMAPAVQVEILDNEGNRVTSAGGTVTLTLIGSGGGTLGGTTSAAAVSGVATFGDLTIDAAGTDYRLVAKSGTLYLAVSDYFIVGNKLAFTVQPQDTMAGDTMPTVEVTIQDGTGATVTGATDNITLELVDSNETLYGTPTVAAVAGVAQFTDLYMEAAGTYTIRATAAGLVPATSAAFEIFCEDTPVAVEFIIQPSTCMPGVAITPAIQVALVDNYGNTVTTATDPVTLDFDDNPTSATLGGTLTVDAVAGIATFDDITVDKNGNAYSLIATSGSLSDDTSDYFDVGYTTLFREDMDTSLLAKGWTFSPGAQGPGWEWGQPTGASAEYGEDDPDSGYTGDNVLGYNLYGGYYNSMRAAEYATSPAFSCAGQYEVILSFWRWLSTESSYDHARVEVFDGTEWHEVYDGYDDGPDDGDWYLMEYDISEYVAGKTNVRLRWSMGRSDSSVTYCGWNVDDIKVVARTQGLLDYMEFEVEPTTVGTGLIISPAVKVALKDTFGDTLLSANNTVTLSIGNNPSAGTLSGTVTAAAVNGVATFSNLSIDEVGAGYTLYADCGTLTQIESTSFNVTNKLVITVQPADAAAGDNLTVEVTVQDETGATVTGATPMITLALEDNPGETTLSGTTSVAAVAGVATFDAAHVSVAADGYTLVATATGYGPSVKSAAFDISPAAYSGLEFGVEPSDVAPFEAITPAVRVDAVDAYGNIVPTATGTITMCIESDPAGYATLLGTLTAALVNGSATFSNLSIDAFGEGFSLEATDGTYTVASGNFDVRAVLFEDMLSTDPATRGWTFSHPDNAEGWAWGQPTGEESSSGYGDPDSGYTGDNCLGYNIITCDYIDDMLETEYVTTPAFSCAGFTSVTLSFYGWAGFESSCDYGPLQVWDGTIWHTIYDGYDDGPDDDDWYEYEFDISSEVAGKAGVKIRWGVGPTDGSVTYQGWNIDDVVVTGIIE